VVEVHQPLLKKYAHVKLEIIFPKVRGEDKKLFETHVFFPPPIWVANPKNPRSLEENLDTDTSDILLKNQQPKCTCKNGVFGQFWGQKKPVWKGELLVLGRVQLCTFHSTAL